MPFYLTGPLGAPWGRGERPQGAGPSRRLSSLGRMEKQEILVALTAGDSNALGKIWRITAKKSGFYLEPLPSPTIPMPMTGTAISLALTAPHPGLESRSR